MAKKIAGRQIEVFMGTNCGVVPKPSTQSGKFLNDYGQWINLNETIEDIMKEIAGLKEIINELQK
jgi:hypothetical protein